MAVINGTASHDELHGTADDDLISGLGDDDHLDGGGGNDTLAGGNENDFLVGNFGNDSISGDFGNDTLLGGVGDDTLVGGDGDDYLRDNETGVNILLGGQGNDWFDVGIVGGTVVVNTATGGAGQDTYFLGGTSFGSTLDFSVTDFAVGPTERDRLDVDPLLAGFQGYTGGNPFALGYLRLLQSGDDTLLQADHDGPDDGIGSEDGWVTQLTLKDAHPSQITAANFVGGIPPDGSEVPGDSVAGSAQADTLIGGFFNDTISGLGGNDRLEGKGGDDRLSGEGGNDVLLGSFGDDTLLGGDGDDSFFVLRHVFIEEGDGRGDDRLIGGAGNDRFADNFGNNVLEGGEGDDLFHSAARGAAGDGTIATGGSGRDTYAMRLPDTGMEAATDYIVTDFAAGGGGDLLDFRKLLVISADGNHYTGGNPFSAGNGFLRFTQSGSDTLVQWDRDGAAGATHDWATQLTLQGVLPGQITTANVVDGIPVSGAAPGAGKTISGTANSDTLTGGYNNDHIYGFAGGGPAGIDFLNGGFGNDWIDGGADWDFISGGFGDDTLIGGDGDDQFTGSDQSGDASHTYGNDRLIGGNGDDHFEDYAGINVLSGGAGNDSFLVSINEGAGNRNTATGGSGRDTYRLVAHLGHGEYISTDFVTGAGGDLLDFDELLAFGGTNAGYGGENPFTGGYIRLLQSGDDTLLQWDMDGAAGGESGWITMLTLRGIVATDIAAENFTSRLVVGTAGNDSLLGGLGNDTVRGLGGNDTLDGSLGKDLLEGGSGSDLYFVDHAKDVVREGSNSPGALMLPGDPTGPAGPGLAGAAGITDTVIAAVNYSLANISFVENLTLAGAASRATGNALANRITGNAGADVLNGGAGKDTLDGGEGGDRLIGGTGNDTLVWGTGDLINGGAGTDTLQMTSGDLDLATLANDRILNVETINMTGGGNNTLTLTGNDVLDMSSTDTLKILGNAGDVLNLQPQLTVQGAAVNGFRTYTLGAATLLVESDVTVVT
jgi:Ca2+-binding RTX toxin-like protein